MLICINIQDMVLDLLEKEAVGAIVILINFSVITGPDAANDILVHLLGLDYIYKKHLHLRPKF